MLVIWEHIQILKVLKTLLTSLIQDINYVLYHFILFIPTLYPLSIYNNNSS
jgi:hypothetical protein